MFHVKHQTQTGLRLGFEASARADLKISSHNPRMAELWRLESKNGDPSVGGFVARFPSGALKRADWQQSAPLIDTKEAAKKFTTSVVQSLLDSGLRDDVERTNWASFAASVQRFVIDWNERLTLHLHSIHAATNRTDNSAPQ